MLERGGRVLAEALVGGEHRAEAGARDDEAADGAEQRHRVAVRRGECHLQQPAHEGGCARGEQRRAVVAEVLEAVERRRERRRVVDEGVGLVERLERGEERAEERAEMRGERREWRVESGEERGERGEQR